MANFFVKSTDVSFIIDKICRSTSEPRDWLLDSPGVTLGDAPFGPLGVLLGEFSRPKMLERDRSARKDSLTALEGDVGGVGR